MRKSDSNEVGRRAEARAAEHLSRRGLQVLTRNYRCRWGEIDLVMRDRDEELVFVEVRYRGQGSFATGAESVDTGKQRRLAAAAEHYLQRNALPDSRRCRFDVVSVGVRDIDWIRDAFEV